MAQTHYCKFKRTALCENALHYDNETTINKQILCRFQKLFFQRFKKCHTPFYLQMFCALSDRSLSRSTPVLAVLPPENTQTSPVAIFLHLCASSSFKDAAPKVLWKKVISRRSKELKSDPGSRPLVWAPC